MIDLYTRYCLALFGQAITGLASPFIASVPTKVSQHWFDENQRPFVTAVLGKKNTLKPPFSDVYFFIHEI